MNDKRSKLSPFVLISLLVPALLIFGILACNAPTSAVNQTATEVSIPIVAPSPSPFPQLSDVAPVTAEATASVSLEQGMIGFWKTKVVGKEVIVFEFKEGGKMTWHYTYASGMKKDSEGTYTLKGTTLTTDIGSGQELTAKLEGGQLTLTGPDQTALILQKIDTLDGTSPTASKDISADIVARWQDVKTQEWIEFKTDGSLTVTSKDNELAGSYKINGNQLELTLKKQAQASTFTVEIDNNVLTLIAKDGSFVDYTK
jgi:hypothetical protein